VRRLTDARLQGLAEFAASLNPEQRGRLHAVLTDISTPGD
jgi:hypothetical protein